VSSELAEKKLDIDEDRQNPAYIPRKGLFYEHDLRIEAEDATANKTLEQPKKKLWLDDRKWLHDRYDEHAQMPKTRQELIAVYGHDIRTSGRPDGDSMTRRRGRARCARGSRGMHQLKDFMADRSDGVNRHYAAGDQLSDGHEAVMSDTSDNEDTAHHQPERRAGGRRGQGRPGSFTRGRYSEVRQQYGDDVRDADRPRYSNVRGRGFRNDRGGQRRGYGSGESEKREVSRDVEYRPDTNRGPGRQPVGERQRYEDRPATNTSSGQSREQWDEQVDNKPVEQCREHFHATAADSKVTGPRLSHGDRGASSNVRNQWQDKPVQRESARHIHPTRTISNRHYQTADIIANKDRSSQIGSIVDAMNKLSVKTVSDDRRDVDSQQTVAAKTAMIVSGSAVADIIPPVTQTRGRTMPPAVVTSAKLGEQDVKDFVPRMTIIQSNEAASQHMSKPKRYSTQNCISMCCN